MSFKWSMLSNYTDVNWSWFNGLDTFLQSKASYRQLWERFRNIFFSRQFRWPMFFCEDKKKNWLTKLQTFVHLMGHISSFEFNFFPLPWVWVVFVTMHLTEFANARTFEWLFIQSGSSPIQNSSKRLKMITSLRRSSPSDLHLECNWCDPNQVHRYIIHEDWCCLWTFEAGQGQPLRVLEA